MRGREGVATRPDDAEARFHAFFTRHHADLARLAYLLTGDGDLADDIAADAFVALWDRWDRFAAAGDPLSYARGIVANIARTRIRGLVRERRRLMLAGPLNQDLADDPDVPAMVDVQEALRLLPFRKRACVVLRHGLDLSERETARILGISVGTVKSQTSRGLAELNRILRAERRDTPVPAARPVTEGADG